MSAKGLFSLFCVFFFFAFRVALAGKASCNADSCCNTLRLSRARSSAVNPSLLPDGLRSGHAIATVRRRSACIVAITYKEEMSRRGSFGLTRMLPSSVSCSEAG